MDVVIQEFGRGGTSTRSTSGRLTTAPISAPSRLVMDVGQKGVLTASTGIVERLVPTGSPMESGVIVSCLTVRLVRLGLLLFLLCRREVAFSRRR